jgi:hypothetical protein
LVWQLRKVDRNPRLVAGIGAPVEFDALTDDELERAVVERFRALGLRPSCPKVIRGTERGSKDRSTVSRQPRCLCSIHSRVG